PSGLLPAAYQPSLFPPGGAAPSAKDIPGGETLPNWSDVEDERPPAPPAEGTFAIDRIAPVLPQRIERAPLTQAALAALEGRPAALPAVGDGVPPMPTMRPLGADYPNGNPYPFPAAGFPDGGPA